MSAGSARSEATWRNRDVWSISLSACFADLGYQSVLAGFPLFLVLVLHQPVWEFGLAAALSYGGGSVFSWVGARAGDRIGHRRLALAGNAAIPLLSLSALIYSPAAAIGLLCGGWWARNLRSPSRRVMLTEAVPDDSNRNRAFGFLHALDVGGGVGAGVYVLVALSAHLAFRWLFLATALPLVASTVSLSFARTGARAAAPARPPSPTGDRSRSSAEADLSSPLPSSPLPGARSLLLAAALYGFTYYSVGFPVLSAAQRGASISAGIAAFLVFQVVSALTGYLVGGRLASGLAGRFFDLGGLGYLGAAVGSALLALGYATSLGYPMILAGTAVVGFALGVIETLEPALMGALRPGAAAGRGFGALSAARSFGVFAGNLVMGLLYGIGPAWSYGYATLLGVAAAVVVFSTVPLARQAESQRSV